MNKTTAKAELQRLQAKIDAIRGRLGVSAPDTVLYEAPVVSLSDETVVVEADGFGGAMTMVVEGNYPIDCTRLYERTFRSEQAACKAAQKIVAKQIPPGEVLG